MQLLKFIIKIIFLFVIVMLMQVLLRCVLFPSNALDGLSDNQESLVKAIDNIRAEKPNIIYLGDSVLNSVSKSDEDRRKLSVMIDDKINDRYDVVYFTHWAFTQREYFPLVKYMHRKGILNADDVIIIPINMRAFSNHWYYNPNWQFDDFREILDNENCFYKMFHRSITIFGKEMDAENQQKDESLMMPVMYDMKQVGVYKDFEGSDYKDYTDEKMKKKIVFHYMQGIDESFPLVMVLDDLCRFLKDNEICAVFYYTPVDYEICEQYVGMDFTKIISDKKAIITETVKRSGFDVLDYSRLCTTDMFSWKDNIYPNEHLNEKGRKLLSLFFPVPSCPGLSQKC